MCSKGGHGYRRGGKGRDKLVGVRDGDRRRLTMLQMEAEVFIEVEDAAVLDHNIEQTAKGGRMCELDC